MDFKLSDLQLLVFIAICAIFVKQNALLDSIVVDQQPTTNDTQSLYTPFLPPQGEGFQHR